MADHWSGSDYEPKLGLQFSQAERLLQSLHLQGDEKILDIGCGDGKITTLLSKMVPQGLVIGIDPSLSMLAQAEEVRKESRCPNLSFCQGAAENFALNENYDHIFAIYVLHWVKEQAQALKNIHTHLKPNGQVHFIIVPSKEGLPFHTALQNTLLAWGEDFKEFVNPQQVFDMETYRKLIVRLAFILRSFIMPITNLFTKIRKS